MSNSFAESATWKSAERLVSFMSPPIKNFWIAAPPWPRHGSRRHAEIWYVSDTDVPGLATEAAVVEEMEDKLLWMVPEVLAPSRALGPERACPMS